MDEGPFDEYPSVERFTDYMLKTWIDNPIFDIKLWNHFRNADIRVNNNNEGYHSGFNNKCPTPHPNIWKFIELIKEEEYLLVQIRYCKLLDGTYRSRGRNKCDMERDLTILRLKNKYLISSKSDEDLLKDATICVQNFE